ncbi:hypothetical protein, conserved [Trypanosoma brucei gambiense DAL972]|uniref:Haemolysin-III related n=1 Tax=Trypanosoma brucei gambiense (strain MHOM/CI/86/DAL972) TaxID=679716 RepID=C9ZTT2_TRYB9|nr:hypothetical protein, conserved [Trypanosoma brucei gambiense DAL972]CBH12818.1 hypothetical protein, conserved [Trypanosoma brucei gambiense DAL972]|eukprot:XP_011775097.1 hypothetical protein, conserved [Trypanosoma brucei gambiense DAL972]
MEVELEPFASWLVCVLSVVSHATLVPTVYHFLRKRYAYESVLGVFGLTASLMYHICEAFDAKFFMSSLAWHRVDNILVISLLGAWSVYMCALHDPFVERFTKYSLMMLCLIFQTRGPWEAVNSVFPAAVSFSIPIGVYVYRRRIPALEIGRLVGFILIMAVAVIFFIKGLDDKRDHFRMYHSLWHFFCGIASYLMWTLLKVPGVTGVMGKSIHV